MRYSVIVPMYNAQLYIKDLICSIAKNDTNDMELIVINDGSSDDSYAIADRVIAEEGIKHYRLIEQNNQGVSAARNKGISVAEGDYLIFCDSDDILLPGLFDRLNEYCGALSDMVVWPFYNESLDRRDLASPIWEDLSEDKCYSSEEFMQMHLLGGYKVRLGSFAIKKKIVEDNHIVFDEKCTLGEDVEFFLKAIVASRSIQTINAPYYVYKKHSGSLAYSYNIRRFEAPLAICRVLEMSDTSSLSEDIREYLQNGLYVLHTMYAIDSCVTYIKSRNELKALYREYRDIYNNVEVGLRQRIVSMRQRPYGISGKRFGVLRLSTWLYFVYMYRRKRYGI